MVPGTRYPNGSPSIRMPARPSAKPAQNRSGRSVYCTSGNAVPVLSTRYSSMLPVARAASISISSKRAFTCSTISGSVIPSRERTSTLVRDCRPTICSAIRNSGAFKCLLTKLVFVRRDSTKESLDPFRTVSFSGSDTERFSSVPTLKESTDPFPGKKRRQLPAMRSATASSAVVRSSTPKL